MKCTICEIDCDIEEGSLGKCGMYVNANNSIEERYPDRYLAAVPAPIEAMPMVHYHPNGKFMQVCTVGCNFRCNGCVSDVLTDHLCAIEGVFQEMKPGDVIKKALEEGCIGVMFCFNEPTVSYFTFRRLAEMAKTKNLLVGCSTNGYMTEEALNGLIPFLDFVNIGIKGFTDKTYRKCGVDSCNPVIRNLKLLYEQGVHVEISAIFRKNGEEELGKLADYVASLSRDIPIQLMRFIPLGDADPEMEPSVREAEAACERLRKKLHYVYLFNSPGTSFLNSCCPQCGGKIIERSFYGAMCSNVFRYKKDGVCDCGFKLPFKGEIHIKDQQKIGYFGGYKNVNALNMIRSILGVIGVDEKEVVDKVLLTVLKEDYIKDLFESLNGIHSYLNTVDHFGELSGRQAQAKEYRDYVLQRVNSIAEKVNGHARPTVYYALGHPQIAIFKEKIECALVDAAGGDCINRLLKRDNTPGLRISKEEIKRLSPEIIIISGAIAYPVDDFLAYCSEKGLDAPAIRRQKVYNLHPYRTTVSPDWILGLMSLANIIHPELFAFDMEKEADDFFLKFLGISFSSKRHNRSFLGLRARAV